MAQRSARPLVLVLVLGFVSLAAAFIPAAPANATLDAGDSLQSSWGAPGFSRDPLYRVIQRNSSTGEGSSTNVNNVLEGALVHFTEQNSTVQPPSRTPWIALIKCDVNGSTGTYSMERDIFSLAYEHGAQAIVLYSRMEGATSCAINPAFTSDQFGQPSLDVWTVATASAARSVQGYFDNFPQDSFSFNSALLNASESAIITALDANTTSAANRTSFVLSQILFGVRSMDGSNGNGGNGQPQQGTTSGGSNGPNTGLAMIILYAITGCVTFMFLVVIMSGAIRAIRHPERYGPRARDPRNPNGNAGQSRAGGLTRAILDTFPVVKFGRSDDVPSAAHNEAEGTLSAVLGTPNEPKKNDLEAGTQQAAGDNVEMVALGGSAADKRASTSTSADEQERIAGRRASNKTQGASDEGDADPDFVSAVERRESTIAPDTPNPAATAAAASAITAAAASGTMTDEPSAIPSAASPTPATAVTVDPAAVDNKSTCPICVCDFEDGDDLRILPCAGKHVFHKDCIDPWLLDVSSLCPLCRWDFRREASESEAPADSAAAGTSSSPSPATPPNATGSDAVPPEAAPQPSSGFVRSILAARSGHGRESTTATTASTHQHRFAKYLAQVRMAGPRRRRDPQRRASEAPAS